MFRVDKKCYQRVLKFIVVVSGILRQDDYETHHRREVGDNNIMLCVE